MGFILGEEDDSMMFQGLPLMFVIIVAFLVRVLSLIFALLVPFLG
jgi:hypothetical protein